MSLVVVVASSGVLSLWRLYVRVLKRQVARLSSGTIECLHHYAEVQSGKQKT